MTNDTGEYISRNQLRINNYEKIICERYKIESDWYLQYILREIWNEGARMGVDQGPW